MFEVRRSEQVRKTFDHGEHVARFCRRNFRDQYEPEIYASTIWIDGREAYSAGDLFEEADR